jgi:hypothetical protein
MDEKRNIDAKRRHIERNQEKHLGGGGQRGGSKLDVTGTIEGDRMTWKENVAWEWSHNTSHFHSSTNLLEFQF